MNKIKNEFIEKLYEILETPGHSQIIRWNEDGESFLLVDSVEFARSIMEKYFTHKNLNSFIRQLNKYDFHKIKSTDELLNKYGESVWEFKNPFFKRRRKDLLYKIQRKRSLAERKGEFAEVNSEVAEKSIFLQNQMLNSLKQLSSHFQTLTRDIIELKKMILHEKIPTSAQALIYDEDEIGKSFCADILQRNNFSVFVCESVAEINIAMLETKFDLIIVSYVARSFLSIISSIRGNDMLATLIVSGDVFERNDLLEFQRIGVNDVINKPYTEDLINKIIKRIKMKKGYVDVNSEVYENNSYAC